jgi:thiamine-phosphate pyrophosphorylase
MLLYYITDRRGLAGTPAQQRSRLLVRIGEAARAGVDYIQLREKDLEAHDLERLARDAIRILRDHSATTKLLINGHAEVALASGSDGVHLPAGELDTSEVRALWRQAGDRAPVIAVSTHTIGEVQAAATQGADFAVLAPIFGKVHTDARPLRIDVLRAAAESVTAGFAILALGGITVANAGSCLTAGAAGVAGIRLFQNGDIVETVRRLRALEHI